MKRKEFLAHLKQLVSAGKLGDVFDVLVSALKNTESEQYNTAILLMSQYNQIQNEDITALISRQDFQRQKSKITFSLLELIDNIPIEVYVQDETSKISNKKTNTVLVDGDNNISISDVTSNNIIINNNSTNYLKSLTFIEMAGEDIQGVVPNLQSTDELLRESKLILVGNGRVGKTTIRKNLINENYGVQDEISTHGIDIERWNIELNEADYSFNIWDFGGQGKYRDVQHFFCSRNSIYLFITSIDDEQHNSDEDYIDLDYWLPFINAFGYDIDKDNKSPILHIRNKTDLGFNSVDENKNNEYNVIDYLKISCKNTIDIQFLKDRIKKILPSVSSDIFSRRFSQGWMKVKKELEEHAANYISKAEYTDIFYKHNPQKQNNDDSHNTWLNVLDSIGTVIHFSKGKIRSPEIENLENIIILKPDWVKQAAFAVLNNERVIQNHGEFSSDDYKSIWDGTKYKEEDYINLKELMLAFELCYSVNIKGNRKYFVPTLFQKKKPYNENIKFKTLSKLSFEIQFRPFMPAGIIGKIIVSKNEFIYKNYKWRYGLVLQHKNTTFAEIKEVWSEKKLVVDIYGEDIKYLKQVIEDELLSITDYIKFTKIIKSLEFDVVY